jgi:hypothetical protein
VNWQRTAPALLALLAVLALAGAAATLQSAGGGAGAGAGDESRIGVGDGGGEIDFGAPPAPDPVDAHDSGRLLAALVSTAVVVSLLATVVWIYREGLDAVKQFLALVVPTTLLLVALYVLFVAGLQGSEGSAGILSGGRPSLPGGGTTGGASGEAAAATSPSLAVAAVVGLVVVVALLLVVRSTGDERVEPDVDDPDPQRQGDVAAVGDAAGRAADRIEGEAAFDNAVYRAWREMTEPLDLPRETSTPGEFAEAAGRAGMRGEDVRELTSLFEATRYGGVPPDDDRERRALAALRRIEAEYGADR